jgi:tetratricopeptide (TPR) repeat protein
MKNKIYTLFLCLFLPLAAMAQDSLFTRANGHYINGEYEKAIDGYKTLVDTRYAAPELFFNLGNAYYKSHKLAPAILNYERAHLLDPKNEDILYNLELARSLRVDRVETIPEVFFARWFRGLTMLLASNTWAMIALALFFTALILLLVYVFSTRIALRKTSFWVSIAFFFLSVSAYSLSWVRKKAITGNPEAIVMAPSVTARSTPDDSGNELFVVHEGLKVSVEDELGSWFEVKIPDGNKGWVKKDQIETISWQKTL